MRHLAVIIASMLATPTDTAAARIASLDYCADQYVLALADHGDIAGVSRDALKDFSFMSADARGLKRVRPDLEELTALSPDIVIRQWGGAPALLDNLAANGAAIVTLDYATTFEEIEENILMVAHALNGEARGQALISEMRRRLSALGPKTRTIRALYVTPGGVTAGRHTLIDAAMKAAGVENAADDKTFWPPLSVEELILDPPDLIIAGFVDTRDDRVNHWSASRHDALHDVFAQTPTIFIDSALLSCAAWFSVSIAEEIARAAATLQTRDAP